VPLSSVSNSNIAGKTEVSLEFISANDGSAEKNKKVAKPADELVEIRFYVPGARTQGDDSDVETKKAEAKEKKRQEKAAKNGADDDEGSAAEASEEENEEDEDQSAAQQFHSLVRERASLTSQTAGGALLISFDDILVTTPRGRYDIDMYQAFLR
jgi:structure-specific recognition protein 1